MADTEFIARPTRGYDALKMRIATTVSKIVATTQSVVLELLASVRLSTNPNTEAANDELIAQILRVSFMQELIQSIHGALYFVGAHENFNERTKIKGFDETTSIIRIQMRQDVERINALAENSILQGLCSLSAEKANGLIDGITPSEVIPAAPHNLTQGTARKTLNDKCTAVSQAAGAAKAGPTKAGFEELRSQSFELRRLFCSVIDIDTVGTSISDELKREISDVNHYKQSYISDAVTSERVKHAMLVGKVHLWAYYVEANQISTAASAKEAADDLTSVEAAAKASERSDVLSAMARSLRPIAAAQSAVTSTLALKNNLISNPDSPNAPAARAAILPTLDEEYVTALNSVTVLDGSREAFYALKRDAALGGASSFVDAELEEKISEAKANLGVAKAKLDELKTSAATAATASATVSAKKANKAALLHTIIVKFNEDIQPRVSTLCNLTNRMDYQISSALTHRKSREFSTLLPIASRAAGDLRNALTAFDAFDNESEYKYYSDQINDPTIGRSILQASIKMDSYVKQWDAMFRDLAGLRKEELAEFSFHFIEPRPGTLEGAVSSMLLAQACLAEVVRSIDQKYSSQAPTEAVAAKEFVSEFQRTRRDLGDSLNSAKKALTVMTAAAAAAAASAANAVPQPPQQALLLAKVEDLLISECQRSYDLPFSTLHAALSEAEFFANPTRQRRNLVEIENILNDRDFSIDDSTLRQLFLFAQIRRMAIEEWDQNIREAVENCSNSTSFDREQTKHSKSTLEKFKNSGNINLISAILSEMANPQDVKSLETTHHTWNNIKDNVDSMVKCKIENNDGEPLTMKLGEWWHGDKDHGSQTCSKFRAECDNASKILSEGDVTGAPDHQVLNRLSGWMTELCKFVENVVIELHNIVDDITKQQLQILAKETLLWSRRWLESLQSILTPTSFQQMYEEDMESGDIRHSQRVKQAHLKLGADDDVLQDPERCFSALRRTELKDSNRIARRLVSYLAYADIMSRNISSVIEFERLQRDVKFSRERKDGRVDMITPGSEDEYQLISKIDRESKRLLDCIHDGALPATLFPYDETIFDNLLQPKGEAAIGNKFEKRLGLFPLKSVLRTLHATLKVEIKHTIEARKAALLAKSCEAVPAAPAESAALTGSIIADNEEDFEEDFEVDCTDYHKNLVGACLQESQTQQAVDMGVASRKMQFDESKANLAAVHAELAIPCDEKSILIAAANGTTFLSLTSSDMRICDLVPDGNFAGSQRLVPRMLGQEEHGLTLGNDKRQHAGKLAVDNSGKTLAAVMVGPDDNGKDPHQHLIIFNLSEDGSENVKQHDFKIPLGVLGLGLLENHDDECKFVFGALNRRNSHGKLQATFFVCDAAPVTEAIEHKLIKNKDDVLDRTKFDIERELTDIGFCLLTSGDNVIVTMDEKKFHLYILPSVQSDRTKVKSAKKMKTTTVDAKSQWLESSSNGNPHFRKLVLGGDDALDCDGEGGLQPLSLSCTGVFFAALSSDSAFAYVYKIDGDNSTLLLHVLTISDAIDGEEILNLTMNLCFPSRDDDCDVSVVFTFSTEEEGGGERTVHHVVRSDVTFSLPENSDMDDSSSSSKSVPEAETSDASHRLIYSTACSLSAPVKVLSLCHGCAVVAFDSGPAAVINHPPIMNSLAKASVTRAYLHSGDDALSEPQYYHINFDGLAEDSVDDDDGALAETLAMIGLEQNIVVENLLQFIGDDWRRLVDSAGDRSIEEQRRLLKTNRVQYSSTRRRLVLNEPDAFRRNLLREGYASAASQNSGLKNTRKDALAKKVSADLLKAKEGLRIRSKDHADSLTATRTELDVRGEDTSSLLEQTRVALRAKNAMRKIHALAASKVALLNSADLNPSLRENESTLHHVAKAKDIVSSLVRPAATVLPLQSTVDREKLREMEGEIKTLRADAIISEHQLIMLQEVQRQLSDSERHLVTCKRNLRAAIASIPNEKDKVKIARSNLSAATSRKIPDAAPDPILEAECEKLTEKLDNCNKTCREQVAFSEALEAKVAILTDENMRLRKHQETQTTKHKGSHRARDTTITMSDKANSVSQAPSTGQSFLVTDALRQTNTLLQKLARIFRQNGEIDAEEFKNADLVKVIRFLVDGFGRTCATSHEIPTTAEVELLTESFRKHIEKLFGTKETAKVLFSEKEPSDEQLFKNARQVLEDIVKHLMLTGAFFDENRAIEIAKNRIYTVAENSVTHVKSLNRSVYHHVLYDLALEFARTCRYCACRPAEVCDECPYLKKNGAISQGRSVSAVASSNTVTTSDFAECLFGQINNKGVIVPNTFACTQCNTRKGARDVVLVVQPNGDRFMVVFHKEFINGRMKRMPCYVYQVGGKPRNSEDCQGVKPP